MQIYDLLIGEILFQLQETLICHMVRAASEFFRVRQRSPLFVTESCVIAVLEAAPVIPQSRQRAWMKLQMLGAIMAAIDDRHANVDEFMQLAVERPPHAGIETEKILEHLRTVRQRFLRIAWLAAEHAIVNQFDLGIGLFRFNQCDACHGPSLGWITV
jgi:hypothetical protein